MSLTDGVLWLENAGAVHKAHSYQQLLSALTGHRTGVMGVLDLKVVQRGAGANMSVDVGAGDAVIAATVADSVGAFGSYYTRNNATVNLAVGAADSTNARRDLVVIDVRDSERSGSDNDVRLRIVQGTPSGSPADPTIPASSIVLARLAVAAGATSVVTANITDLRFAFVNAGQTGQLILPAGIPMQDFDDSVSAGTATSVTAFGTHNSIGVAPFDLTMYVDTVGEWGNSGAGSTSKSFQIWDEAANVITSGVSGGGTTWNDALAGQFIPLAARGKKDYQAGDTMGFRVAYSTTASTVSLFVNSKVTFVPKVNT